MGKKEQVVCLCLSFICLVVVMWLIFTMPMVVLLYVNVVFPDSTHLLL